MPSEEDIPTYVKDLIIKMDFVGHVPPGKKLCVRGKYYHDPESWFTKPMRMLYGEDSTTTCEYIDRIVRNLTSIINRHKNIEPRIYEVVKEKAVIFRQGLINLVETYAGNPNASASLRTMLSIIDYHIPEIATLTRLNVPPIPPAIDFLHAPPPCPTEDDIKSEPESEIPVIDDLNKAIKGRKKKSL